MSDALCISAPVWEGERAPLAKAFIAAQKATEAVKKANSNPAFKSKYADLAAVVEAVVPALNDAGVGVLQFPAFDGEWVAVTTTLMHESGSSVTAVLHLRPSKTDPQGVGSAVTYGRRYSLLAMTGGAPEDDDGNAASGPRQEQAKRVEHPPQTRHEEPQPLTLKERADAMEKRLNVAKSAPDLRKAYDLGAKLCAELDDKDPERLVEINTLYERRFAELSEQVAA